MNLLFIDYRFTLDILYILYTYHYIIDCVPLNTRNALGIISSLLFIKC